MAFFTSLYSGSSGNCSVVRCGDEYLLIDMGKSCRTTLTALRKYEAGFTMKECICTDDDFHTAMAITDTLLQHSLVLSTILPGTAKSRRTMRDFFRVRAVLDTLPETFAAPDFVERLMARGISRSSAYRKLETAVKNGMVQRNGRVYRRVS